MVVAWAAVLVCSSATSWQWLVVRWIGHDCQKIVMFRHTWTDVFHQVLTAYQPKHQHLWGCDVRKWNVDLYSLTHHVAPLLLWKLRYIENRRDFQRRLTCSPPGQFFLDCHPRVGLQFCRGASWFMSCGAGVWLSYMYWMTSIVVSGTNRCILIDKITRQWQSTC